MNVAMIGPVPAHWGGGDKWRGGGVASHLQGLVLGLADLGVGIDLLAENNPTEHQLSPEGFPANCSFQSVTRAAGPLVRGSPSLLSRAWRTWLKDDVWRLLPRAQQVRFWGLAVNYESFLAHCQPDLLHVHHILHRPYICRRLIHWQDRLVVTVHSVNYLLQEDYPWQPAMARVNYGSADRLIAVSNFVRESIIADGANPKRITVIPNGVDTAMFSPADQAATRHKLQLPAAATMFLYTGNLVARKGIDVLLQAFAWDASFRPDTILVLIGDGPEKERLQALARQLGVAERVRFLGYVLRPTLPDWYRAADAFVMPSWAEGLSISILEALASGIPVITTVPTVGDHDAVVPDVSGWLLDYGDVEQLSRVLQAVEAYPVRRRQLGEKGRLLVEQRFSERAVADATAALYRELQDD